MYRCKVPLVFPLLFSTRAIKLLVKDNHLHTLIHTDNNSIQKLAKNFCKTWKHLSGITAAKMSKSVSRGQRGVGSYTRGTKHQLMADREVARDWKTRKTNLGTGAMEDHSRCQFRDNWTKLYQGDALSNLLFCIGSNPLNQVITKSGLRY